MAEQKVRVGVCEGGVTVTTACNNSVTNMEVIWSGADGLPHFANESCLPVIGSCQVSSILSTIENSDKEPQPEPEPEPEPHLRLPQDNGDNFKSIAFNVCHDQDGKRKKKKENDIVLVEKKQMYQEMVFFGCNLCPFICTKDSKISDHINLVHKNQENNERPKLKCPGCNNVFYHKLSLRSHLIHDHEVGRSDINKIVNGIVYVSTLANSNDDKKNSILENGKKIEQEIDFLTNETQTSSEDETHEELEEVVPFVVDGQVLKESSPQNAQPPILSGIETSDTKSEDCLLSEVVIAPVAHEAADKAKNHQRTSKCVMATCAVRMRDASNMSYHIRSHCGKVFSCVECGEKMSAWRTLQTHLWHRHKIDMELYGCDKCDYRTYSLAKLNNVHRLIHGDEKPFLCDYCGKGFKNPKQLRNHKIVHRMKPAELQHQCEVCQRTFADRRQLRVHMSSVHHKIKPFSCNYCGYKAASNGALRLHVRQHTGEKPFSCDICDYSTSDHNSLRRHKSRHSGVKKYRCVHCDYACIQSSTYKTHLKTKHPGLEMDLMFSCHLCQFRTISKDKFMIHVASHKDKHPSPKKNLLDEQPQLMHDGSDAALHEHETIIGTSTNIKTIDDSQDCIALPVVDPLQQTERTVAPIPMSELPSDVEYLYGGQQQVVIQVSGSEDNT